MSESSFNTPTRAEQVNIYEHIYAGFVKIHSSVVTYSKHDA